MTIYPVISALHLLQIRGDSLFQYHKASHFPRELLRSMKIFAILNPSDVHPLTCCMQSTLGKILNKCREPLSMDKRLLLETRSYSPMDDDSLQSDHNI